jgi:hypothetical protein
VTSGPFGIWLQQVQPGEARYQQRRIRPYISVVHPASRWQTGNVTAAAYGVSTGGLEA